MPIRLAQPLPSRTPPARPAASSVAAPAIVREVIGGTGAPLDAGSRAVLEPRFAHDFSRVRVHADARAAESARAVGARAYTVGDHVVFGAREHDPGSAAGRRLIAHELAHVVQQRGGGASIPALEVGERGGTVERLAETAAARVAAGYTAGAVGIDPRPAVRRAPPEDAGADAAPPAPVLVDKNWAGATLSSQQSSALAQWLFQDIGVTGGAPGTVQGAKFLLHDTSGASGRPHIESEAKKARGPMGSGPNVYIPESGLEIIQRPDFYNARRPTTTESEKGSDIMDEPKRNAAFRAVWKATSAAQRTAAMDRALAGLPLSADEVTAEKTGAEKELNATKGKVFSTATWTVDEICAAVGTSGAAAVAEKDKHTELSTACAAVGPLFTARRQRAATTASVELVQVGSREATSKDDKVNKNTCDPDNPDNLPLPNPPYSPTQYSNTVMMYLRATIMAGRFPEITTHFVVDAFTRGHCDPRCFDLTRLYRNIAATLAPLGHGPNSTYGVAPSYGLNAGTNTVWWHEKTCHGPPP